MQTINNETEKVDKLKVISENISSSQMSTYDSQ